MPQSVGMMLGLKISKGNKMQTLFLVKSICSEYYEDANIDIIFTSFDEKEAVEFATGHYISN